MSFPFAVNMVLNLSVNFIAYITVQCISLNGFFRIHVNFSIVSVQNGFNVFTHLLKSIYNKVC